MRELRLKGKGDEPGFREAFVWGDRVVVHGFYDVLAFGLDDGRLRWRYRVPFAFEIRHALMSGDLLVLASKTETVAVSDRHVYVADTLSRRVVRCRLAYAAQQTCAIK